MRPKSLLIALVCLVAFSACHKSEDNEITPPIPGNNETPPIPKIKEITSYADDIEYNKKTFEYDRQGRLVYTINTAGTTETYTYTPGKAVKKIYFPHDKSTKLYTYVLNDKGLAVYEEETKERFEYDEHGYRIKAISSFTRISTIEEGNTVQTADWSTLEGAPELFSVTDNQYLHDQPNTIGDENMGITFLGRQNKNPLRWVMRTDYRNGKVSTEWGSITFWYEYDDHMRIVKSSNSHSHGPIIRYTYVE